MTEPNDKDMPRPTAKDYVIGFLVSLLVPFGLLALLYGALKLITNL